MRLLFSCILILTAAAAAAVEIDIRFLDLAEESSSEMISDMIDLDLYPVGMEQADGSTYMMMFSGSEDMEVEDWKISAFPHDEINQGLSTLMEEGWMPVGFDMQNSLAMFLLLKIDADISSWGIIDVGIESEDLAGNFQRLFEQDMRPMDISVLDGRIYILAVESPMVVPGEGLIQSLPLDTEQTQAEILRRSEQGFIPWGLGLHNDSVLMLFLQ